VPDFTFVPVALGTVRFESLVSVGGGDSRGCSRVPRENALLLTTSDLNHYEDDATTRIKDHKAIERFASAGFHAGSTTPCRDEEISMCGLGPAVAMLTALKRAGV